MRLEGRHRALPHSASNPAVGDALAQRVRRLPMRPCLDEAGIERIVQVRTAQRPKHAYEN